ncbi:ankyrin repeat domain-containing protein [Paraphoma chrysanthemicola]|uniref:Ankyrin repeat domain-containing protein n=1 Tax=Paraphoma chrysanthemicola TaxID=798071 RepID=A0A8K0REC4_9PLEO|nr:ankyrin repeat domain-containing protein [Paraphoma chrysanthemicola]
MDPLSITGSIIAILQLSAKVLAYLNDVKDASKDRAQCEIEMSNLYSLLVSLRSRLEEGSASQPWYTAVRALASENGPLDQYKQALETLQAKMNDGSRLKKVGEALMWKFREEEVMSFLARIERLKTLIGVALELDHFKLSQAIKDETTQLRKQVPAIQSGIDRIQQNYDSTKHRALLDWISSSDYPAQQSDIISRKEKGTGQWFLDAPEVSRWLNEATTTLFCPGIPGAGKTMIAAIAIDYLLNTAQPGAHRVAYVYCNYKAQNEQDVFHLLTAILKQLVSGQPSTMEHIERLHRTHADRGTKPSLEEITVALRNVLDHCPPLYIVIDALDECLNDTRRQLLARLDDLRAGRNVSLMVTSRFIPDIESAFKAALRLEVRASREDVKRYISSQMYRLPACIQRDAALQDTVLVMILDAVNGMFLLARLHVDSLLDKRTTKAVKMALAKLTNDADALDIAYEEALHRMKSQPKGDHELAKRVITWITFAKRPLTTTEICCALAVEPEETELDSDNVPDTDDIVSVCAGLVVVDHESAVVRLVHYTTQEYFERTGDAWVPDGQLHIARTCLTYLCFDAFQHGACSTEKDYEERLRRHQFLEYAARYWGEHARAVEADIADQICIFVNSNALHCAVQARQFSWQTPGNRHYSNSTPLCEVACLGLAIVARTLASTTSGSFTSMVKAKANDNYSRTPLELAASEGHCEMVKMLLEYKADINAQHRTFGSALYSASSGGHEQVVQILLDYKADVNPQNTWNRPLHAASSNGHEQIVRMLLANQADVNAQDDVLGSALYAASASGHEQIVKLLLANQANVNAQTGTSRGALQVASERGHEQIVKTLLANKADVNAQNGRSSALCLASANGHEQIVEILLANKADVNAQSGRGSALYLASEQGHDQIVKTLLANNADVSLQGREGSPLYVACVNGHVQTAKILLENHAGVNAQGRFYSNAMHAAAYEGHTELLDLLITNSSSSLPQDYYGRTLLWLAAAGGHAATVEALIHKHNMDPRTADNLGRNPSWIAGKKGHGVVLKLLQGYDGEPNAGQAAASDRRYDQSRLLCDVCTSSIPRGVSYYHCDHCSGGDWNVCDDCIKCGATCMDTTHVLVKPTTFVNPADILMIRGM